MLLKESEIYVVPVPILSKNVRYPKLPVLKLPEIVAKLFLVILIKPSSEVVKLLNESVISVTPELTLSIISINS